MDDFQPRWLKPGQSLGDYITTKRKDNISFQSRPFRQIARKSYGNMPRRRPIISRMTPAPTGIIDLSDSEHSSSSGRDDDDSDEVQTLLSKRTRDNDEMESEYIDLRVTQARRNADRYDRSGRIKFPYHKQARDIEELDKRMGNKPQKKLATQVAYKSSWKEHLRPSVQSKSALLFKSRQPRSAARKTHVINVDEHSSESTVKVPKRIRQLAYKSARYQIRSSSESSEDGDAGADEESEALEGIDSEEGETDETNDISANDESSIVLDIGETSPVPNFEPESLIQLFRAFQLHTDSTSVFQETKQLPFLLRNLRKSFKVLCHNLGVPCIPLPDDKEGSVLIRYEHLENVFFEKTLSKWFCPLCDLFGRFETRDMLRIHLELAHKDIFFEWFQPSDNERQDAISWRLHVLFPEIVNDLLDDVPTPETATPEPMQLSPLTQSTPNRRPMLSPRQKQATPSPETRSQASTLQNDPSTLFPPDEPATPPPQLPPQPKKPRPREYPRPPPSSDRLGAAARPPYLPAKSTFGGPDIYYSTRVDGPYLFDLLQLLPLEPFGLLEWMVLDREEEIFADEELNEEQKVIMALWARWIMLNKNEFMVNRANGAKMFIDEYWRMIHLAAGWQALVDQLVVLGASRLLKSREIAELITYYEDLVGMDYWDEWDSEEE